MHASLDTVGADFGTGSRRAALQEWHRRARAERPGALARHPIAISVAVGIAVGLALALIRNERRTPTAPRRSGPRNTQGAR